MLKYLIPLGIGAGIAFAVWKLSKSSAHQTVTSPAATGRRMADASASFACAPDVTGPMRAAGIQRLLLPQMR